MCDRNEENIIAPVDSIKRRNMIIGQLLRE